MRYSSAYVRRNEKLNKWQGFLRYKNDSGQWRQTCKTLPKEIKTRRQAERALSEWRTEMELQAASAARFQDSKTKVPDYVDGYIDDLEASKSIEAVTAMTYRGAAKHIRAAFSDIRLSDLTTTMIQKWENDLVSNGYAASTVTKYHRVLSEACKHAVDVEHLMRNPCSAVKVPKLSPPSPNSLAADAYARLAATLDAMEPSPVVTAAAIALHAGLRQGEVCGLRWRSYDRESETIHITESIANKTGGGYSKQPKTLSSRRIVPVSPQLAETLERRRTIVIEELQTHGITLTKDEFESLYIIGYIDGRFYNPRIIGKEWKALSEAFGLTGTQGRRVTFHDLRHSFATRAIAAGADVKSVAAVLGHTNAAMTLNVYADADPESKRRATDLVAKAIESHGTLEPYATPAQADS